MSMTKLPKGYRQQCLDCEKANVKRTEYCPACSQELIICLKYGGQCRSNKCREERGIIPTSKDFLVEK